MWHSGLPTFFFSFYFFLRVFSILFSSSFMSFFYLYLFLFLSFFFSFFLLLPSFSSLFLNFPSLIGFCWASHIPLRALATPLCTYTCFMFSAVWAMNRKRENWCFITICLLRPCWKWNIFQWYTKANKESSGFVQYQASKKQRTDKKT